MENRARFGKLTGHSGQKRLSGTGKEGKNTYVNYSKSSNDHSG